MIETRTTRHPANEDRFVMRDRVLVAYASQTGRAEKLARQL
ncbi:MAG: hypothetical protein AAF515_02970 [Pseudomonadota bacterium]